VSPLIAAEAMRCYRYYYRRSGILVDNTFLTLSETNAWVNGPIGSGEIDLSCINGGSVFSYGDNAVTVSTFGKSTLTKYWQSWSYNRPVIKLVVGPLAFRAVDDGEPLLLLRRPYGRRRFTSRMDYSDVVLQQ